MLNAHCMQKGRSFWPDWSRFLRQWGIAEFAAALLETASPLNLLIAQMVYAGRPLLGSWINQERLMALAGLFEDRDESRAFAAFIREESIG